MQQQEIVKEVIEKGGLDLVIDYTKKFIDAATPVAKQAYEIGLMTLQIDALATLIPCFLVFVAWIIGTYYWQKSLRTSLKREEESSYPDLGSVWFAYGMPYFVTTVAALMAIANVFSVWLWVKLFKPELWLAHEAIEKLVR